MTHTQARQYLHWGRAGLSADQAAALEAHLAGCEECRAHAADTEVIRFTTTAAMRERWGHSQPSSKLEEKVLARLGRISLSQSPFNFRAWAAVGLMAALVASLLWAARQAANEMSGSASAAPTFAILPPSPTPQPRPPLPAGFMLGGQVAGTDFSHSAEMRQAGLTWIKLDIVDLTQDVQPMIAAAHAHGFRVLFSVRDQAAFSPVIEPAYQQKYTSYVAQLAGQGADALEIWPEANTDRWWPNGHIDGATYARFLATVAAGIKQANPDTLVISGAPAPTGFFGGCEARGCDDKPFVEKLASAGAFNSVDCIGLRYTEGLVSPEQTRGDPRDNYYTRYYPTMLDTYRIASGNLKPLCLTEVGYLTADGYAALPPAFAWAATTTLSQQAAWLASAARIAKARGDVRLLIVFNVDFTDYGSDAAAGYAMIRKDGACPACQALTSVIGVSSLPQPTLTTPPLSLPQLTPAVEVSIGPYLTATTTAPVYVRSGPSHEYAEWAVLAVERKFDVIGRSNGWWQIDLGNGISGWVDGAAIEFKGQPYGVPVIVLPTLPPPPQATATHVPASP